MNDDLECLSLLADEILEESRLGRPAKYTDEERKALAARYGREYREKRKALGLCNRCDNPRAEGLTICDPCRQKIIAYRHSREELVHGLRDKFKPGPKPTPRTPEEIEQRQKEIKERQKQYRAERIEAGLCALCNNPRLSGYSVCETHRKKALERAQLSRFAYEI